MCYVIDTIMKADGYILLVFLGRNIFFKTISITCNFLQLQK